MSYGANLTKGIFNPPVSNQLTASQLSNANKMSAATATINNSTKGKAILYARIDFETTQPLPGDREITFTWYNPKNKVVATWKGIFKKGWTWAYIDSWLSHVEGYGGQIDEPGIYTLDVLGQGLFFKTATFEIKDERNTVIDPDPEPTTREHYKKLTLNLKSFSYMLMPFTLIPLPVNYIGGGLSAATQSKINRAIQDKLPDGWELMSANYSDKEISFEFKENGTPAIPIAIIIGIIAGILILVGFVIGAWKLIDYYKEKEQTTQIQTEADIAVTKSDLATELSEAGFSADDIAKILDSVYTTPDQDDGIFSEFKDIILYLMVGMAVIILVQQMAQAKK